MEDSRNFASGIRPSFYVNYESFRRTEDGFRGEKIGFIKTASPLPELPEGQSHYNNPRISFNGKHWFISVGIERPEEKVELTSTVLGIDVGIKVRPMSRTEPGIPTLINQRK